MTPATTAGIPAQRRHEPLTAAQGAARIREAAARAAAVRKAPLDPDWLAMERRAEQMNRYAGED